MVNAFSLLMKVAMNCSLKKIGDLSSVAVMEISPGDLKVCLHQLHLVLEGGRRFIIEELEDGFQSARCEYLMKFGVGEDKLSF